MKITKTVTASVLAANRTNSKASTGPKTKRGKSTSSRGAVRHGILSNVMILESDATRAEYAAHRRRWNEYFKPQGPEEEFLVDEMTIASWKLRTTEALELKELARHEQAFDPAWGLSESRLQLPIDVHAFPLDHAWNCEKLVVRALARDDHSSVSGTRKPGVIQNQWANHIRELSGNQNRQGGNLEIEAVLGSTFENLSRYGRSLRNNLYRAMNQLRTLRDEGQEE